MSSCPSFVGTTGNYGSICFLEDGHDGPHRGEYNQEWPNKKPPRERRLVVVVKIETGWPKGSVDLSDAINRLTQELPGYLTVVTGFEPRG